MIGTELPIIVMILPLPTHTHTLRPFINILMQSVLSILNDISIVCNNKDHSKKILYWLNSESFHLCLLLYKPRSSADRKYS